MAEKKAKTIDELCRCAGVSSDRLFTKALSYADDNLKKELDAISKEAEKKYKIDRTSVSIVGVHLKVYSQRNVPTVVEKRIINK